MDVRAIGLDIAKLVFQLHGADAAGSTVLQKRLTRRVCCRSSRGFRAA